MTNGILTDKGMNDEGVWIARIDDKPYPVLGYVLPFLEKIEKGSPCEYTLKDGKITKISRIKNVPQGTPTDKPGVVDVAGDAVEKAKEKMAKAGFNQPSEKAPGAGLPKTVTGVIKEISQESRKLVVYIWDAKVKVPITWAAPRDGMMAAFKAEDKVKITYEVGDPNLLSDIQIDKPKGGQKTYTPRNERPIIYQCCYKEACETARRALLPELSGSDEPEKLYQHVMDIALARAKKDAAELIKESGA